MEIVDGYVTFGFGARGGEVTVCLASIAAVGKDDDGCAFVSVAGDSYRMADVDVDDLIAAWKASFGG